MGLKDPDYICFWRMILWFNIQISLGFYLFDRLRNRFVFGNSFFNLIFISAKQVYPIPPLMTLKWSWYLIDSESVCQICVVMLFMFFYHSQDILMFILICHELLRQILLKGFKLLLLFEPGVNYIFYSIYYIL